jgi:CheY-like chemotaxis protein
MPLNRQLNVLLVDDDDLQREIVSRRLIKMGCHVTQAENGTEGFLEWQKGSFALVISDCHMPSMDGFELAQSIREQEAKMDDGKRVRIIALTADITSDAKGRAETSGIDSVLVKPVTREQLGLLLAQRQ